MTGHCRSFMVSREHHKTVENDLKKGNWSQRIRAGSMMAGKTSQLPEVGGRGFNVGKGQESTQNTVIRTLLHRHRHFPVYDQVRKALEALQTAKTEKSTKGITLIGDKADKHREAQKKMAQDKLKRISESKKAKRLGGGGSETGNCMKNKGGVIEGY